MITGIPALDKAVNKPDLTTRDTGEFASENVGFGLNPGVAPPAPKLASSNRRESKVSRNLRNVADTDDGDAGRCCQQNRH